MGRTGHFFGLVAVAGALLSGMFALPVWGVVAAAAVLVLLSLGMHQQVYAGYERAGRGGLQPALLVGSILNAAVTTGAAYVAGVAIAWAWGL